ncbi:Major facilitator superfamily domain [Phytophthora cactorum]|nr:Major facilitator superfamily domain [Phytophthora cactorum]
MPSTLPWVYLERQQQFWGPPLARGAVSIGTTLFLIGHIVTALGIHYKAIAGIYIGYGIITAIGLGMCYTSPMSTLQNKAYLPTIDAVGLLWMFVLLGAVMGAAIFASALVFESCPVIFLSRLNIDGNVANVSEGMEEKLSTAYKAVQTPTGADKPETVAAPKSPIKPLTLKQAVFTPDYIFMYLMFFANQLFGVIVRLVHVFNCCGRLAFSAISDFLVRYFKMEKTYARKVLYYFTLGAQIIVIGSLPTVIRHESFTFFVIEIFVLTCSYGGGLGTIPALVTDMFGAYNVGPFAALFSHLWPSAYIDNIQVIFVIVCIGFVVLFLVRTNAKDRFEPGYHYSLCGKRVISIPPKEKDAMNQQEAEEAAAEKLPETAV